MRRAPEEVTISAMHDRSRFQRRACVGGRRTIDRLGLLLWAVLSFALMLLTLAPAPAQAVPTPEDVEARAAAVVHPWVDLPQDQVTVLPEACLLAELQPGLPPDDAAPWLHVHLPHRWKDTHPGFEGSMWYRFRVTLPATPQASWAIYLPRVVMNAQVWVNGVALDYTGSMADPVTRHWYVPLLFNVPSNLWKPGDNLIHVRVASGYQARNGLAPIQIGPVDQVASIYQHRKWTQVDGVQIAHVAMITLGLVMVTVWLRDRSQSAFGFMGASALFWGVSTLMLISPTPFFDLRVWERLSYTATVWYQLALTAFFFRFTERPWPWVESFVITLMVLLPAYYVFFPRFEITALVFALIYALALTGMVAAIGHVLRARRPDGAWLVLGCGLLVPAGAHDVMVQIGSLPFDEVYWLPAAGPVMIACTFMILVGDYARSRQALADLNAGLASRVTEREQALRESFERLAALESAQAVSAERSRILKDMHDGVGAHLTSALRQLTATPQGEVDVPLVTQTLRDSLDQLKLSIDAMSLQPGDVVGLLASWRFRLTPRLKAAGLELVWDVDDLPPWPPGQPPVLRQLQYILFEGLSNVLQHSGATRLVLSARVFDDHLRLSLIDNGRGWHTSPKASGHGLQTMQGRASLIGARLEFLVPTQGGLELRLSLPRSGQPASALSSAA